MAGIKDVAKRAGVSISTVSYVMSGKRSVKVETKIRVLQAARELNYFPRGGTRVLRGTRTNMLALSSPEHDWTDYTNYSAFFFGVAQRAQHYGYDVLLLMGEEENDDLKRISDSGMVDGLLLLDVELDDPRVEQAKMARIPVVSIGYSNNGSGVISIDLDFKLMGQWAVEKAYKLGHRHVLMMGSNEEAYAKGSNFLIRTERSVDETAAKHGMNVVHNYIHSGSMEDIEQSVEDAFRQDPELSVVFAQCNLEQIEMLIRSFQRRGLDVPRDMSILALGTFGNTAKMTIPVDEIPMMPFVSCGRSVDVLMDMLSGKRSDIGAVELIPPKYLKRGSMVKARKS
ncbi:LacI family DNA-binding transcriptional regulator [Bifidobacterium sp. ESL0690]|uniref:LacI family DNA-binding transcriptional regulator n=1 Tax=Bifidobacterium sp. ESL0690 TaxID=2983214 RepID=UPI0023F725B0|nr:LacI family DNA-binding transcriptional regulator [Bifidobacterium sp. ESL0690]WEV46763.1 LacI family DNA-binding transcriptional regulator [Bifidobacterium sp. ESL0690]